MPQTGINYWRDRLFSEIIVFVMPLGIIALIPGIYMAYLTDLHRLIIVDLAAGLVVLIVAFASGITVQVRKLLFILSLYFIALALLYDLGSFGPGLLYLLALTVLMILIFDKVYAYASVGLNVLVCIAGGIVVYYNLGDSQMYVDYDLDTWVAVSSNLVFLSAVLALLIPMLFDGLQKAMDSENVLQTELKQNQKRLEKSIRELNEKNEELESFAYTASHDLKEPLRMIHSFMGLLKMKYSDRLDEKAQEYIYYAVDGAERMTNLVNELLEYSRVGRVYANIEKVDVNKVMEDVYKFYAAEISKKNANIQFDSLPVIQAVPVSIKLLFQNLIGNALKYNSKDEAPVIVVEGREKEDEWEFSVQDNGIGISPDSYEKIFQLFQRIHSSDYARGAGMGLAICKKIVEQHDGRIWVSSSPGKGSTFYFTIQKNQGIYEELG